MSRGEGESTQKDGMMFLTSRSRTFGLNSADGRSPLDMAPFHFGVEMAWFRNHAEKAGRAGKYWIPFLGGCTWHPG